MRSLFAYWKKNPRVTFYAICICFLAASGISLILSRGELWRLYLLHGGNNPFSDFFFHIAYCGIPTETYFVSYHACFPAFSYFFFFFLYRCVPYGLSQSNIGGFDQLIYLLYNIVFFILLYRLIRAYLKNRTVSEADLLCLLIIFSAAFVVGVIGRGSVVLIALVLLLIALLCYNADSKWKREVGMLCIAFAAGFKIYPAIFGLLYLFDKRYKEAARLVLYGLIVFFVPFAFFGGVDGLVQFFRNQLWVQANCPSSFTIPSLIKASLTNLMLPAAASFVGTAATVLVALLCIVGAYRAARRETRCLLLVSVMVLCPGWSGPYTLAYYLIPLLMMLSRSTPPPADFPINANPVLCCLRADVFADHASAAWQLCLNLSNQLHRHIRPVAACPVRSVLCAANAVRSGTC